MKDHKVLAKDSSGKDNFAARPVSNALYRCGVPGEDSWEDDPPRPLKGRPLGRAALEESFEFFHPIGAVVNREDSRLASRARAPQRAAGVSAVLASDIVLHV